jgi:hypothetical protein
MNPNYFVWLANGTELFFEEVALLGKGCYGVFITHLMSG